MKKNLLVVSLCLFLSILLSACGGGGGEAVVAPSSTGETPAQELADSSVANSPWKSVATEKSFSSQKKIEISETIIKLVGAAMYSNTTASTTGTSSSNASNGGSTTLPTEVIAPVDGVTSDTGSTSGGMTGQISFWCDVGAILAATSGDFGGAGVPVVYVNGVYVDILSSYFNTTPVFGQSGTVTVTLSVGSHSYRVENGNGAFSGTLSITNGGKIQIKVSDLEGYGYLDCSPTTLSKKIKLQKKNAKQITGYLNGAPGYVKDVVITEVKMFYDMETWIGELLARVQFSWEGSGNIIGVDYAIRVEDATGIVKYNGQEVWYSQHDSSLWKGPGEGESDDLKGSPNWGYIFKTYDPTTKTFTGSIDATKAKSIWGLTGFKFTKLDIIKVNSLPYNEGVQSTEPDTVTSATTYITNETTTDRVIINGHEYPGTLDKTEYVEIPSTPNIYIPSPGYDGKGKLYYIGEYGYEENGVKKSCSIFEATFDGYQGDGFSLHGGVTIYRSHNYFEDPLLNTDNFLEFEIGISFRDAEGVVYSFASDDLTLNYQNRKGVVSTSITGSINGKSILEDDELPTGNTASNKDLVVFSNDVYSVTNAIYLTTAINNFEKTKVVNYHYTDAQGNDAIVNGNLIGDDWQFKIKLTEFYWSGGSKGPFNLTGEINVSLDGEDMCIHANVVYSKDGGSYDFLGYLDCMYNSVPTVYADGSVLYNNHNYIVNGKLIQGTNSVPCELAGSTSGGSTIIPIKGTDFSSCIDALASVGAQMGAKAPPKNTYTPSGVAAAYAELAPYKAGCVRP